MANDLYLQNPAFSKPPSDGAAERTENGPNGIKRIRAEYSGGGCTGWSEHLGGTVTEYACMGGRAHGAYKKTVLRGPVITGAYFEGQKHGTFTSTMGKTVLETSIFEFGKLIKKTAP